MGERRDHQARGSSNSPSGGPQASSRQAEDLCGGSLWFLITVAEHPKFGG